MAIRLAETKQQQTINEAANDLTKGCGPRCILSDLLQCLLIESSADIRLTIRLKLAATPSMQQAI